MNDLEAHARFALRQDRSILQGDFSYQGVDSWPAAATAAAILSGQIEDALTDEDLDTAVDKFFELIEIGGIWTRDEAREKINEVGGQVLQALMDHGELMGWNDYDGPETPAPAEQS